MMLTKLSVLVLLGLLVAFASCEPNGGDSNNDRPIADYLQSKQYERIKSSLAGKRQWEYSLRSIMTRLFNSDKCGRKYLNLYVDALFLYSDGNLDGFVNHNELGKLDNKTHTKLLNKGRRILDNCLAAFEFQESAPLTDEETLMDRILALGDDIGDNAELLARARNLNLLDGNFEAMKMLDSIEHSTPEDRAIMFEHERLHERLVYSCLGIRRYLSERFVVYNLARLLKPEAAAGLTLPIRFHKLNEYRRICKPVNDRYLKEQILANIRRNTN